LIMVMQSDLGMECVREFGDANFVWRAGVWLAQRGQDQALKAVPLKLGQLLDQLKCNEKLVESAPGLFRFVGAVARPLQNDAESPLTRLSSLKQADGSLMLDAAQLRAGEHLRRDYERAHFSARVTAKYEADGASGGRLGAFSDNHIETLSEMALDARDTVHAALDAVGPELSGILLHVCCMAAGLEQAEMRLNLPRRAGKAILQMALTRLARHYGFKPSMRHAGPGQIGHWAISDFRPQIARPGAHQP
jgi:Domain of unknown function (DUF6456)